MGISRLERQIELPACAYARALGIKAYKIKLASEASWPDRTFMYKGQVMMIEFKRPGEVPTPLQQYTINELRQDGFDVHVCFDLEHAKVIIWGFKEYVDQQLERLRKGDSSDRRSGPDVRPNMAPKGSQGNPIR